MARKRLPVNKVSSLRGPWQITCHYADVDGRQECVGIDVRSFRSHGEGEEERHSLLPGDDRPAVVTASAIRALPISSIIREWRMDLALWAASAATERGPRRRRQVLEQAATDLASTNPRAQYDDGHFEEVARIYAAAWRAADAPTKAVADELNATRNQAAKWVQRARQMGLLGPTDKRQAGGVPADPQTTTRKS